MNNDEIYHKILNKSSQDGECTLYRTSMTQSITISINKKKFLITSFVWRFHNGDYDYKRTKIVLICGNENCINTDHMKIEMKNVRKRDEIDDDKSILKALVERIENACEDVDGCLKYKEEVANKSVSYLGKCMTIRRFMYAYSHPAVNIDNQMITATCDCKYCIRHLAIKNFPILNMDLKERVENFLQNNCQKADDCLITEQRQLQWKQKMYCVYRFLTSYFAPETSTNEKYVKHVCSNDRCVKQGHYTFVDKARSTKQEILEHLWSKDLRHDNECSIIENISRNSSGYGEVRFLGKNRPLHRIIYWIKSDYVNIDDIPVSTEMVVAHQCRNLCCINADHYSLKTPSGNMQDKIRDGTDNLGEKNANAKLTLNEAQQIADLSNIMSVKDRAAKFRVSRKCVSDIDNRKRWPQVDHPNGKPWQGQERKVTKFHRNYDEREVKKIQQKLNEKVTSNTQTKYCADECMNWAKQKKEYPIMYIFGTSAPIHHWGYLVKTKGLMWDTTQVVRHMCDNKLCCNPNHFETGTYRDNQLDQRRHESLTSTQKLRESDIKAIRASSELLRVIAERYDVSISHIASIRAHRVWKNV